MTGRRERVTAEKALQFVVSDANVLINFAHIGRMDLFGGLPGYRFLVPDHVLAEIAWQDQAD